ncbi:MAG: transglycosylase [Synechococcaceae bacterium WB9_2_112]|nr:transglycosylase [Synechococcaceae bacterium WB9_2_112]
MQGLSGYGAEAAAGASMGQPMITSEGMPEAGAQAADGTAVASAAVLLPLYAPYWGGLDPALEKALLHLLQGRFEGVRRLDGGLSRTYLLQWTGARAPLDPTRCALTFPERPGIHYDFAVPAHRLLRWLASTQAGEGTGDLPDDFWHWLILGQETSS